MSDRDTAVVQGQSSLEKQSASKLRPHLVYFFSPTDGLSRRVDGYLDAVLQRRGNHDTFDVIRVDVSRRTDLAERFRVAVVPTIVVVESNRVKGRLQRPRGNTAIAEFLAEWLLPSRASGRQQTAAGPSGRRGAPRLPAPGAAARL
jgi:thioredoxin-like negative regulator of GroEL